MAHLFRLIAFALALIASPVVHADANGSCEGRRVYGGAYSGPMGCAAACAWLAQGVTEAQGNTFTGVFHLATGSCEISGGPSFYAHYTTTGGPFWWVYALPDAPPPPDDQQLLCNSLNGTETYGTVSGSAAPGSSACNASGCMATFSGTVLRVKDASGQSVTEGAMTFTDQKCTFSADTGSTEDTCPGGTTGEVNGRTVCVNFDPKTNTIESVKATTSTTANGSGTVTATSTTTTTCSNGSCNTTSTTVVNNNGTTSSETKTTDEPQSDFCAKNPTDPQCTDEGSFTGACAAGFSCSGDAIQCAVAREQHVRNCALFDATSDEAALYTSEKNKAGNQTTGLPGNDAVSVGPSSFDTSDALGGGSCIGDKSITVAGRVVVIPFSNVCEYLAALGNVLLAVSFLYAARIVTRG